MSIDRLPFHLPIRPYPSSPIGIKLENNRLKENSEKLKTQALIDPLTGLYNRRYLEEQLKNFGKSGEIKGVTVIMFDIDNLKKVNDTLGHPAGDEIICRLAKVLKENSHSTDVAVRNGGDEMILVLPNLTNKDNIQDFTNRLQRNFTENNLHVSFGTATTIKDNPSKPIDFNETIKEADNRLLEMKQSKKNQS